MNRAVLIALISAVAAITLRAQPRRVPEFRQFPAVVEQARARTINFRKNPDARGFRTRLSEGLRSGVNFAGHYVLVGWGCGTGCISGAIVDGRNGSVFWPEQLNALSVWYGGDSYDDEPIAYKKNSRMLVITGSPGVLRNAPEKPSGIYYYEWKNNRLRLLRFVKKETAE